MHVLGNGKSYHHHAIHEISIQMCARERASKPLGRKGLYSAASGIPCSFFNGGISLFSEDGWTVTDRSPLSNICHPFPFVLALSVHRMGAIAHGEWGRHLLSDGRWVLALASLFGSDMPSLSRFSDYQRP